MLILADTHIPSFRRELPPSLDPLLERCDVILHGGDVSAPEVLEQLQAHAPVLAVMGNIDAPELAAWGATDELVTTINGVPVAMIHDGGRSAGRSQRLRDRFPAATVIVFAHSHAPTIETSGGVTIVNPGSPTWKRLQPNPTVAWAELSPQAQQITIVELPNPAGR